MTFDELCQEVQIIVKRPDLAERIQSSVRAATEKIHSLDFFYKDLVEVPVQFESELNIQNFVPKEIIPKFRKAKYIRFWHGDVNGSAGVFLTPIQIENAIDSYGCDRVNVYYMAGTMLQMRTNPAVFRVLFGAYIYPTVTPITSYSSWIAEEYPWAIVYEAARTIFRSISLQEQAGEYEKLTAEVVSEIRMSCIDDIPVT